MEAAASRPLTGFGPDSFAVGYTPHRSAATRSFGVDIIENSAHNWALQILVTTGLLGLSTFLALLASWALAVPMRFRTHPLPIGALAAGVGAHLANGLVSVGSNGVDWYLWLALGAVIGLGGAGVPVARALPSWTQVAVLAAAAAASLSVVSGLEASRAAHVASSAFAQKQSQLAEDAAMRAVRTDPGRSDHWNWLGLAQTLRNDWNAAGAAFANAALRSPYNSMYLAEPCSQSHAAGPIR